MASPIIESLKAQIAERVAAVKSTPAMGELLKLHGALNNIEDVENVPRTSLVELFGLEVTGEPQQSSPSSAIIPGQYLGQNPLEAAKDYLSKRKKGGATLDEIIAGLKAGSCDPGNRDKFGTSMARSTFNFVKLGGDIYDLLDRYPSEKEKRSAPKRKPRAENETSPGSVQSANVADSTAPEEVEEKAS